MARPLLERIFSAMLRPFGLRALSADAAWLRGITEASTAASGVEVTEETALGEVTVFACTRAIAWGIASLPRRVYRELEPVGKERLKKHPVARVMRRPNEWMNGFVFWSTIGCQMAFRGYAYAQVIRDNAGRMMELWPLPYETRPVSKEGRLFYEIPDGARAKLIESSKVAAFRALCSDGVTPFRPVQMAAEAVGLALAAERFAARFFGNGSNLSGVLTHPGRLSPEAKAGLRKSWKDLYSGVDNAFDVAVLEEGLAFSRIGTEPDKSQLVETRKEQALAMCRLLGVPPPIVGILEGSSYATAEQQNQAFATHTIRPLCEAIEAEADMKFFTEDESDDHFTEHNMDALLRADFKTRMEGWGTAIQNGIHSVDEVRDKENENPLPDGKGADYFHQVNLVAVPDGGLAKKAPAGEGELGVPVDASVQDTALNGAQITSVVALAEAVAAGRIPAATAIEIILISFPTVSREEAEALINPAAQAEPPPAPEQPAPPEG